MNQTSSVEHLLSMTQEIGHAASLADWPEAARLTEARSSLLMALSAQQELATLEMIRKIQAIDAAILADAKATQIELEIEYEKAIGRTKAAQQYLRTACG
ncbi:flagellar protein FliT [Paraburkholderia elongata]|uniref:Flagellar protein FliT n=1 Tax=Paraburkholderia elongata TaxID=2675747 RepID=A0A972NQB9_9BURK|nr:flagellar protein FliT [Paraburkholderia elongata]NPT55715.1 flagellar protein FliT [Paraburkholderia elongata]